MSLPTQLCLATSIPGPKGTIGAAGADGIDGTSATTLLTAPFTMPDQLLNGNATVSDSSVFSFGQVIFLAAAGYMKVQGIPDGVTLTLYNLRDDTTGDYPDNTAGGIVIPLGALLSPAGPQGPTGAIGGIIAGGDLVGNYPNPTLAAFGIADAVGDSTHSVIVTTDNKGRVISAVPVAIAFPSGGVPGGSAGGDLAGTYPNPTLVASGVVAETYGNSVSWPILTIDAKGRVTSASVTTPALFQRRGLLGKLIGANFAVTTDQPIAMSSARYRITDVIIENTNPPLGPYATAGAIYTGASKTGPQIAGVFNDASLDSSDSWFSLPLSTYAQSHIFTAATVYMSLTLANANSGTGNVWLFGDSFA